MRALGWVFLIALLVGGLVFLLRATEDGATPARASASVSTPATREAAPVPSRTSAAAPDPHETARDSKPARASASSNAEPRDTTPPTAERESAVETIEARVRGFAFAASSASSSWTSTTSTDAERLPVPGVVLRFLRGDRELATAKTALDGRFEADFAVTGPCTMRVDAPQDWKPVDGPRALTRDELTGRTRLEVHLARSAVEIAGDIDGFLLSESGAWTEATLPKRGAVLVDLVSVENPHVSLRGDIEIAADANGAPTLAFRFANVPRGEWELMLSALDGFRWHPPTMRVTPPVGGLSFLRYDEERSPPLVFEVVDADTEAKIESFEVRRLQVSTSDASGVFLHTGPMLVGEAGAFSAQGSFAWSLWADGHAPAFGDESSFVERDGRRVARVRLAPGWGTKVFALAKDPIARPLVGAEVYLDGRLAGRTGNDGMLVVSASERPGHMDVRFSGFVSTGDPLQPFAGKSAAMRGQVTLAFLEPER